jgi:hypothetical protein
MQPVAARFFFDKSKLPVRNDLMAIRADESYKHPGAQFLDNEVMALRMVELSMAGWGVTRTAREMHAAAASVRVARTVLMSRGQLAPYKKRVVAIFESIVEVGAADFLDALERGLVAPGRIPVGVGIISDKRACALGEPTSIAVTGTAQLGRQVLAVESLNSWFSSLPIDMASDVLAPIHPQMPVATIVDAVLDATRPFRVWSLATTRTPRPHSRLAGARCRPGAGRGGLRPEWWTSIADSMPY